MYVVGMVVFHRFSGKNDFGSGLEEGGGRQRKESGGAGFLQEGA